MLIGEKFSIIDIVSRYGIKNYLYFQCRLPYQLLAGIDVFDINTNIPLSKNLKNKNRKIIYALTDEYVKNQSIPAKSSFVECNSFPRDYSFFITNIDIVIEINLLENEIIQSIFDESISNKPDDELTTILQSALEIFASKYNEAMSGKDIFNPIAGECGASICYYCTRDVITGEYRSNNAYISPSYGSGAPVDGKQENLREIIDMPYTIWKYFYNKSKYSYSKYKNLDCILYGAISLESYLNYLIQLNGLEQKFNIEKENKEKDGKAMGFFGTTKFLKDESVLSKKTEKSLNSAYGKISTYRNNIVHGIITTPLLSREIATKTIDELKKIYNNIPTEIDSSKISESFETITRKLSKEKKYFMNNGKFENIETINSMIENNEYREYCLLLRGIYYMSIEDYNNAILDLSECIKNNYTLKTVLHCRAKAYISSKKYKSAIEDMNKLEELLNGEKMECIYIIRGIALYYIKDYEESLREIDIAISLYDTTVAHYYKAILLKKLNSLKEAITEINIVIEREKNIENYLLKLEILIELKDIPLIEL